MLRYFSIILCLAIHTLFAATQPPQSIYDVDSRSLTGQSFPFSALRGRVLLIVNTASTDKNAPQMAKLEDLYQKFANDGLVVLAIPSNDFLNDEPGTNQDILAAYQQKFQVTFPILEKANVKGPDISPLYAFLTSNRTDPNFGWEVDWNFTKFLVDKNGNVINRFSTITDPMDQKIITAIEKALSH